MHAGAEADEAVALAAREPLPGTRVAQDAPGDQPSDLHASDVGPAWRPDPQRIALVLQRRLGQLRVEEASGMMPGVTNLAVHRAAVGMSVEHVHEYAHLDGIALE